MATAYAKLNELIHSLNKVKEYTPRIQEEMEFVKKQRSAELYLTAYDIVSSLKQKNIIVGPAKGHVNSALINYILGFTTVNPIEYDLACELFFATDFFYLNLQIGEKVKLSKKQRHIFKDSVFDLELSPILKKYQIQKKPVNYKFNSDILNHLDYDESLLTKEITKYFIWKIESPGMVIHNENDLINSLAFSYPGLKGFHLSNIMRENQYSFEELKKTNGLLLFQEQWISLVSKYTNIHLKDVCKIKKLVSKKNYSKQKFFNLFAKNITKDLSNYLFDIVYFLPTKSQVIYESKIMCAAFNL